MSSNRLETVTVIVPQSEPSLETHKPDTSATLLHQQIWYQDTGRPSLWRTRSGELLDTAALEDKTPQGENAYKRDFYSEVLQVVQIVFPLDTDHFPLRVRTGSRF